MEKKPPKNKKPRQQEELKCEQKKNWDLSEMKWRRKGTKSCGHKEQSSLSAGRLSLKETIWKHLKTGLEQLTAFVL